MSRTDLCLSLLSRSWVMPVIKKRGSIASVHPVSVAALNSSPAQNSSTLLYQKANNIMARAGGLIPQGPLGREISKFFFCLPSSGDVKTGEDGLGSVM